MDSRKIVKLIFWLHWCVALMSHIFVILMIGGVFSIVLGTESLGFWVKGLMLGMTFYSAMYAVNHVTNKDGFCVLTDLENFYRVKADMPKVAEFTPRFYKTCRRMAANVQDFFRRKHDNHD